MRKLRHILILTVGVLLSVSLYAIPSRPNPPRLVNDLAGIFSSAQASEMEAILERFAQRTSNQIVVLTVNDLEGQDKAQFAYEVGEKWGVGKSKFDNGVVILVKPKTGASRGEVFIAVGYGLEGAIPDIACKRVIEEQMIPYFRNNDYYGGVFSALKVIMPLAEGEFSYEEYVSSGEGVFLPILLIVVIGLFVLVLLLGKGGGNSSMGGGRRGSDDDFWKMMLLGSLLSNRGGSGRGGGGSFGGGSFGGGFGGGFGGFGGGSFGGGGAGGSW